MATTTEARIFDGLMRHLHTLSLTPALPIADPGIDFDPPATGFLRPAFVPNTANQAELGDGGRNRFLGLFMIGIFRPKGIGETDPIDIAGKVAAHFKRGTVITEDGQIVRVLRPPLVGIPMPEDTFIHVPVTVYWQADAANP